MKGNAETPPADSDLARLRAIEFDTAPDSVPAEVGFVLYEVLRDERGEIHDGILVDVNERALVEFGLPRECLLNKRATGLFGTSPQVISMIQLVRELFATGKNRSAEMRFPWNGKRFLMSLFLLGGDRFGAVAIDITERRQAEEALRKNEEKYRMLFESMGEGIALAEMIFDDRRRPIDYVIVDINPAYEKQSGLSREQVLGKRVTELLPVVDPVWFERYGGVVSTGRPARFEEYDGSLGSWFEVHAYPLRQGNRFAIIFADITERKRMEEELRQSEVRSRGILQTTPDGVILTDLQGTITYCNEQTGRQYGYTPSEIVGENAFELIAPEDRTRARENLMITFQQGEVRGVQYKILKKDGAYYYGELNATLIGDADGRPIGFLGVLRDITERQQAQEALRESEDRYRIMAEELYEADRHKNEFLAVLSHELRNPLASIQNSLRILDRAAPGGEQAKRAKAVIDRQFGQLTHLVDDLLDITRITQNKIRLQRQRLEVNELVRRTVDDHRSLFEQNGLNLAVTYAPCAIYLQADGTRLAQVIGNLLLNAAKFTPRGGSAHVVVTRDMAEKRASIHVRDTGEGISAELFPLLFQPFMQAETSKDRSHGGLGLGLALSMSLVKLHGGEISAESAGTGQGAEFIVRLPLDETMAEEAPDARAGIPYHHRRVLLIEDNVDLAESLRELLELDGHEVSVAASGPEGLDKACEFDPEVLLCDIGLPGMDGYAVARAFRTDSQLRRVFLVAMTGYAQPEDLERAAAAGFDRHLAKPPDLAQLERILAEVSG